MEETIFSGYCVMLNAHRTVLWQQEEDGQWYADCSFSDCPHRSDCPIGREISQLNAE